MKGLNFNAYKGYKHHLTYEEREWDRRVRRIKNYHFVWLVTRSQKSKEGQCQGCIQD
jgi:hypothetical protein